MIMKEFHGYTVTDEGKVYGKNGKELKRFISNNVWYVCLYVDGCPYRISIKRIVAGVFVEKPEGCEYVVMCDRNPNNLCASNLKWVDKNELQVWRGRACKKFKDGNLVKAYISASEAGRDNGVSQGIVRHWCNGKIRDKRGYIWEWS